MDYVIRQVSCPLGSDDLFATGAFEHNVTIWSYASRSQVADFSTILDYGGQRLSVLPEPTPTVIVGAYYTHGIAAYDGLNGQVRWQRRDLKRPQQVDSFNVANNGPLVGIGFDARSYALLDAASGDTLRELRAVRKVYPDAAGSTALTVLKAAVCLCELPGWEVRWRQPTHSRAVLHASIAPWGVLVSEVGGPLSCFDLTGQLRWKWTPEPESHALQVAPNMATRGWLALVWSYRRGGPGTLLSLSADGQPGDQIAVGSPLRAEFLAHGRFLVTSDGSVSSTATGEIVWRYAGNDVAKL